MFTPPVYNITQTERVKKLRDMLGNRTTEFDLDRARVEKEVLINYPNESRIMQRARMLTLLLERKPIKIYDGELIVGNVTSKVRGSNLSGELYASTLIRELDDPVNGPDTRLYDRHLLTEEEKKELREDLLPFFQGKTFAEYIYSIADDDTKEHGLITASSCHHIPCYGDMLLYQDAGHCVPNHEKVLAIGLNGVKKEVEFYLNQQKQSYMYFGTEKKIEFYEACLMTLDAAINFAKRYADLAREMAKEEQDEKRKAELLQIADICERVPAEPARTWQEALQAIWFINVVLNCEQFNFGVGMMARFDQYMLPYYEKGKAEGMTDDELLEILECFYIKTASFTDYLDAFNSEMQTGFPMGQTMNMGGEIEGGKDGCNIVTWAMLEAEENVHLFQPDLGLRVWEGTPDIFLKKALEVLKMGNGKPKFFGESAMKKILARKYPEFSRDELNNCIWIGCQQLQVPYIAQNHADSGACNMGKMLELTLSNGRCRICGRQIGPETGDPRTFKSMTDFKKAFKDQLMYHTKYLAKAVMYQIEGFTEKMPAPLTSALHEGPLQKGKDIMEGGCWKTEYGLIAGATSDVADSLAVIDKLIYQDKSVDWDTMLAALNADWEGYEELRARCMYDVPKFGNDDEFADGYANWVLNTWSEAVEWVNTQPDLIPSIGGMYTNGTINGNSHIGLGMSVAALPSGRKSGTPTADTTSPVSGVDTHGSIAVLKSMGKLPIGRSTIGIALNQRLDPCLFETEEDIERLMAYIRTFEELGVEHLQINVLSSEVLRKAMKDPDNYRDLIVRVATYCSYFTELSPTTQEQILARTEHKAV